MNSYKLNIANIEIASCQLTVLHINSIMFISVKGNIDEGEGSLFDKQPISWRAASNEEVTSRQRTSSEGGFIRSMSVKDVVFSVARGRSAMVTDTIKKR